MKSSTLTLPLTRGTGKTARSADFISLLPVNMLSVPPGVVTDSGFMRSFPGLEKTADVAGTSRGALYNMADNQVFRVCGETLYQSGIGIAQIVGRDRVSMDMSATSVAVAANGVLTYYKKEGTTATLSNWDAMTYYPGSKTTLLSGSKLSGGDASLKLTVTMTDKGSMSLTLTPVTTLGAAGEPLTLNIGADLNKTFNQAIPASGTPYFTEVIVSGFKVAGTTLTVSYTFNTNGASGDDNSTFLWMQTVEPTTVPTAQYDLGTVADVTHANSRYAWLKAGTNTFGVTDLDDETKPDRYRPFMTAESMPDPAIGIDTLNGDIVVFGTASTEFFTLTGYTDTTKPIYKSQRAMLIPIGIAGVHCKVLVQDGQSEQFAVLSHPATGNISVYLMSNGRYAEIASREILQVLSGLTQAQAAQSVLEYVTFDTHKLLMLRVTTGVFCYDLTSKLWTRLCSGINQASHTAVDYVFDGEALTVGDSSQAITGKVNTASGSQYGQRQECILYTPLMKADNARLYDFEMETATGTAAHVEHLMLSATTDGITYGTEFLLVNNGPQRYDQRILKRKLGYVRKNIGFKIRALSTQPFTVANCTLRIG